MDLFRQELGKLGWFEGENITIVYRFADQRNDRLPNWQMSRVRLPVDLVVVRGTPATLAARGASTAIPIVMTALADPVGAGVIASPARSWRREWVTRSKKYEH